MYQKTIWQDEVVEKPYSYTETDNGDGTINHVPAPGTVIQNGTPLSADNLNHMEQGIYDADEKAQEAKDSIANGFNASNNTETFTSGDNLTPDEWDDIPIIATGETHASLFAKMSRSLKNIRFLKNWVESIERGSVDPGDAAAQIKEQTLKTIYPVGGIYISASATSPADLFGFGTWDQIGGKFLFAADNGHAAGTTGGAETVTLTTNQMPAHTHTFTGTAASHNHTFTGTAASHTHTFTGTKAGHTHTFTGKAASHTHTFTGSSATTSSSGAHTHSTTAKDVNNILYVSNNMMKWQSAGNIMGTGGGTTPGIRGSDGSHTYENLTFKIPSLSVASAGAHTHTVTAKGSNASTSVTPSGTNSTTDITPAGTNSSTSITPAGTIGNKSITPEGTNANTGGGAAHNNMPPYLAVYMWKRTA